MGFMNLLRKLGIVKSGKETWKGDVSNRPAEIDDMPVSDKEKKKDTPVDTGDADM